MSDESDSDSTSSSSASEAANGRRDVGGRNATKGAMRVSISRNTPPISPTVTFRSPEGSLSDTTPAVLSDGRSGVGKETKGVVKATTLATSRSAISITPRVTFKSLAIAKGPSFASSPLILENTPERVLGRRRPQARNVQGVGKAEIRKGGGGRGLSGDDISPRPTKGPPRVSPAAAEPMARASTGRTTTMAASTGESGGDNGTRSIMDGPDTVAAVAPPQASGRSGDSSTVSRTNGSRRESAVGSLASGDSPTMSTTPTRQEARTSDTPNVTSPRGTSISLTAVEGITRVDGARIGSLPREATAPRSSGEESPSATLQPEASSSSQSKRASQELIPPEVCRSDQDTMGSGTKPTESAIIDEGGASPSTLQDTTVSARQI